MRLRQLTLVAAAAVTIAGVAAGCGGSNKASTTTTAAPGVETTTGDLLPGQAKPSVFNDASTFVLQADDVPQGYVIDAQNTRSVTNADAAKGRDKSYLRQLESWGRIVGYAVGWIPESVDAVGPGQIQSSASTFSTVGGAEDAFAQGVKEADALKLTKVELKSGVGDEARMWTTTVKGTTGTLSIYELAWRSGQVLATIAVTSKENTVTPADALDYAQKQESRIKAASAAKVGK